MSTQRDLLHKTHKAEFEAFMIRHGFESLVTRGDFEVFRFRRQGYPHPVIVYDRIRGEHFTTFGAATDWARRFYNNKAEMREAERKLKQMEGEDDVPF